VRDQLHVLGPWACGNHSGGPQSQFGYFGEEKYLLLLPGIEPQFFNFPVVIIVEVAVATACGGGGGGGCSSSSSDSLHVHCYI
jgi:hypothetical protein